MPEGRDIDAVLKELWKVSTVPQRWAFVITVSSVIAAVAVAADTVGGWNQKRDDQAAIVAMAGQITEKDEKIAERNQKIAEMGGQINERDARIAHALSPDDLSRKAEEKQFLLNYLRYLMATEHITSANPTDERDTFIDAQVAMYKSTTVNGCTRLGGLQKIILGGDSSTVEVPIENVDVPVPRDIQLEVLKRAKSHGGCQ